LREAIEPDPAKPVRVTRKKGFGYMLSPDVSKR
jgi:hypothetical protein